MVAIKYLGETIELTDAEYEQIMKCSNYKYKTKSGHVVKGLDSTVTESPDLDSTVTPKVCKASDPALGLTIVDNMHVVTTNAQLDRVCKCKSINYLFIGLEEPPPYGVAGCADCQQETLDACQLESITGNWQTGENDGML